MSLFHSPKLYLITESLHILQKYWRHASFRAKQEEIINAVLSGKDVLAVLPTGGGKSVCFQVPALQIPGLCLVVSPLIALMKDQVENLLKKNISAAAIHSGMPKEEVNDILIDAQEGKTKFLYIAPERIETTSFQYFLENVDIGLIAVDEAHCISQWGYDFRPSYLKIARIRILARDAPVIALTASATEKVRADIVQKLYFRKYEIFSRSFERPNLSYSVFEVENKITKLVYILRKISGSGIVYCKTRRSVQDVTAMLQSQNIDACYYHAGVKSETRNLIQEEWIQGKKRIIVCTNAFGMGIDKADVRIVVHYHIPDCLENYYQEAGRAGRDERKAYAVLLYNSKDIDLLKALSAIRFPSFEIIKRTYGYIGDFLQLPSGTGQGETFDFNFAAFVSNFQLDTLQTIYALKAIEDQGHIEYNESFFVYSKVQFTTDRDNVEAFEDANPVLEPIIKALLRTYEGIFSKAVFITEAKLAFKMHTEEEKVKKQLQALHRSGIIDYMPQKETPQLSFLKNRAIPKYMYFDHNAYTLRRKNFEDKLSCMLDYVRLHNTCRSIYIADYFGDKTATDCGVCDICLSKKKRDNAMPGYAQLVQEIAALSVHGIEIRNLEVALQAYGKERFRKMVAFLQAEDKIRMDTQGKIYWRK